jgi:glutaredoxin-related protein
VKPKLAAWALLKNWRYPFLYDWLLLSSAISTQYSGSSVALLKASTNVYIFLLFNSGDAAVISHQFATLQRAKIDYDYVRFKQATRLKLFLALRTDDKDYQKLCKRAGESLAVSSGRRMAGMWLVEIGIMAVSL